MTETFSFNVNGEHKQVEIDRETALLYVLRNDLGLKGARFGCGQGLCGACMVIVDGRAIYSCDTPVWSVADKNVETIEGLATDDALHVLQQAFLDQQAGQCGYCLTGIIMRAKSLLDEKPAATRTEIAEALERNLCRCGAHARILDAIEQARDTMSGGAS